MDLSLPNAPPLPPLPKPPDLARWRSRLAEGIENRRIARFLQGVPFSSVLDVRCGRGSRAVLAREAYLGIDPSPEAIADCERRFAAEPSCRFVRGDCVRTHLPVRYDLALLVHVLADLTDEEAHAVLRWAARSAPYLMVLDNSAGGVRLPVIRKNERNARRSAAAQERLFAGVPGLRVVQVKTVISPVVRQQTLTLLHRTGSTG